MENFKVTKEDILDRGFLPSDVSKMFDSQVGNALNEAIAAVPSPEILDEIIKNYVESKNDVGTNKPAEESDSMKLPDDDISSDSDVAEKYLEPEEVKKPIPETKTNKDLKMVSSEENAIHSLNVFKSFENKFTKVYDVVLPVSGGKASVTSIPLSAMDAISNSSHISEFDYYSKLIRVVYNSIESSTFNFVNYNDFLKRVYLTDIDELLFGNYKLMYGDDTTFSVECGKCQNKIEAKLPLEKMRITSPIIQQKIASIIKGSTEILGTTEKIFIGDISADDILVQTSIPTLDKQFRVMNYLDSKNIKADTSTYKFLLHIDYIALKDGDHYVKFENFDDIHRFVDLAYSKLDTVNKKIDTYETYFAKYSGTIPCPDCGANNKTSYDIKTDFLIKALNI